MPSSTRIAQIKYVDTVLTRLARGHKNGMLIGDNLFPTVTVDERKGQFPIWGFDDFINYNTLRAAGAESNVAKRTYATLGSYLCEEHDLVMKHDQSELDEATEDLQRIDTISLQNALMLGKEVTQATLAQDASLYAASNLDAVGAGSYLDIETNDPIVYMADRINDLKAITGKQANVIIFSDRVWRFIKTHVLVKPYLTATAGNIALAKLTDIASILEVEKVIVGDAKTVANDLTTTEDIWLNNIIFANIAQPSTGQPTMYDPNYGYTLQLKGNPVVDKYSEVAGKVAVVRNTDAYDIKVVGQSSAFLSTTPIDPSVYTP